MQEIWKDVSNYEGYYQVSNLGKVKSLLFQNNVWNKKQKREKVLKQKLDKHKNYRVELWKNGTHKTFLVARLIAFTFYDKDINNEKLTVNHIDGNRLNNKLDNLEVISLKENIQHAFRNGLNHTQIKVKIIDKITGTIIYPSSLAEGSKIIDKNKGYLSGKIKSNIYENEKYKWVIVNGTNKLL